MPRVVLGIVFLDIVNSTRLTERLGDLNANNVIRVFFECVALNVDKHAGEAIKYIGDGALIVFQKPQNAIPFVFDLKRAVSAKLSAYDLKIRASIHVGEVDREPRSYGGDIFGGAVNLAARLNSLAGPDEIVISDTSVQSLSPDQKALLGQTEHHLVKGFPSAVGFNRISLSARVI